MACTTLTGKSDGVVNSNKERMPIKKIKILGRWYEAPDALLYY